MEKKGRIAAQTGYQGNSGGRAAAEARNPGGFGRAKVRRAQREAERAEWEAAQAKIAREREQEQNADWYRAEDSFLGTQHLLRQAMRLRENRATGCG